MITRVGKYEVQAELDRAACTRVYRGWDPSVGRAVALKLLAPEAGAEQARLFRQAAAAAAHLRHKNIATLYELGEHNGVPYLAMELVEGESLPQWLAAARTPSLLEKLLLLWQVGEALQGAGGVALDLRLESILALPDGTVKLSAEPFGAVGWSELGSLYEQLLEGSERPPGLGRIMARLREKDRELGYQSVEELQFDLEPILVEAKRQRAGRLVEQARGLWAEGQWETAQGLLREAVELEPGNREGRQLWERVREQARRRGVEARLEKLLGEAGEAEGKRRWAEAVERLEVALRLAPDHAALHGRLEQCRKRIEGSLRAAALI
ncbi:MAG: protein kinase, partial [Gemmatimonadales bacterium]